jgi:hypothetical protein
VPINPWMSFDPDEVSQGGELAEGRNAVRPYDGWVRALLRFRRLVNFGDRYAPAWFWSALTRLHLYTDPAEAIEQLAERGVRVMLLCGDLEARQFTRRGRFTMRRLERSGLVRLEVMPGSDHTLFGAEARTDAIRRFLDYVETTFGPGTTPSYESGGTPADPGPAEAGPAPVSGPGASAPAPGVSGPAPVSGPGASGAAPVSGPLSWIDAASVTATGPAPAGWTVTAETAPATPAGAPPSAPPGGAGSGPRPYDASAPTFASLSTRWEGTGS